MALTLAELTAYLTDQTNVAADQAKLSADQTQQGTDAGNIAADLQGPAGALSADGHSVIIFTPVSPATTPPTFTTATIPLITS